MYGAINSDTSLDVKNGIVIIWTSANDQYCSIIPFGFWQKTEDLQPILNLAAIDWRDYLTKNQWQAPVLHNCGGAMVIGFK